MIINQLVLRKIFDNPRIVEGMSRTKQDAHLLRIVETANGKLTNGEGSLYVFKTIRARKSDLK